MACKFIAPFLKGGKNDNNDAEAICEAVTRSTSWFVPIKTADQQAALCIHRVRQGLIGERTALIKCSRAKRLGAPDNFKLQFCGILLRSKVTGRLAKLRLKTVQHAKCAVLERFVLCFPQGIYF